VCVTSAKAMEDKQAIVVHTRRRQTPSVYEVGINWRRKFRCTRARLLAAAAFCLAAPERLSVRRNPQRTQTHSALVPSDGRLYRPADQTQCLSRTWTRPLGPRRVVPIILPGSSQCRGSTCTMPSLALGKTQDVKVLQSREPCSVRATRVWHVATRLETFLDRPMRKRGCIHTGPLV